MIRATHGRRRLNAKLGIMLALAVLAAAASAGSGAMQTLFDKLPVPPVGAATAATEFGWDNKPKFSDCPDQGWMFAWQSDVPACLRGTPQGPLAASLDALQQAQAEQQTQEKTLAEQNMAQAEAASPAEVAQAMRDPQARAELQKKLAGMSDQEKMAYAMKLSQQYQQGRQQQMMVEVQAAGQPSAADKANYDRLGDALGTIAIRRSHAVMQYDRTLGELDGLKKQRDAAHLAINQDFDSALRGVPFEQQDEAGGGCYSSANAERVHRLVLEYADRHVAQANRDLAQAAQWASGARAQLAPVAREDDELMGYYAGIHNAMLRKQAAGNVLAEHETTLNQYFQPYADAVREVNLDAARWVYAKQLIEKKPPSGLACK